jgi:myo-inositol 2-dehydrogenase/D-chiro-inositol 1-dehydrogenase
MAKPLHIGVIGLGPRWQKHYKPALLALRGRFHVAAVCDQVYHRALVEAKALGCRATPGPTALLEDDGLEAVLLLGTQWFRLWPLERACRLGKPVFCGSALELDEAHADALQRQVQESKLPVLMALTPRFAPATARLRELLDHQLGPARLLTCDCRVPASRPPAGGGPDEALLGTAGIALVDWCTGLMGSEPIAVRGTEVASAGFASLLLEFPGGRAAQITRRRAPATPTVLRLEVVAERGTAVVELPGRVAWTSTDGRHVHRLARQRPLAQELLERFHPVVREGLAPKPSFDDAHRALSWLRAALKERMKDEG